MKYTKEQLEVMSDFEINKLVAEKERLHNIQPYDGNIFVTYEEVDADTLKYYMESVDYCNSWADMGTIIERNGININFSLKAEATRRVLNFDVDLSLSSSHKNPLRAAAIVYLLMEEL